MSHLFALHPMEYQKYISRRIGDGYAKNICGQAPAEAGEANIDKVGRLIPDAEEDNESHQWRQASTCGLWYRAGCSRRVADNRKLARGSWLTVGTPGSQEAHVGVAVYIG